MFSVSQRIYSKTICRIVNINTFLLTVWDTTYNEQNFSSDKILILMKFIYEIIRNHFSAVWFLGSLYTRTSSEETCKWIVIIIIVIISEIWTPHVALCRVINNDHATVDHLFIATQFISRVTVFEPYLQLQLYLEFVI